MDFSKLEVFENIERYNQKEQPTLNNYNEQKNNRKKIKLELLDPQSFLPQNAYIINSTGLEESTIGRNDGKVIVGFDEKQCDICIPYQHENEKTHFVIYFNEKMNNYFVMNQKISSTTFIKINKEIKINKNYIISIGESNLIVDIQDSDNIVIKFLEGPKSGQTFNFEIKLFPIIIGKGQECSMRIDDPSLSRNHFMSTLLV